MLYSKQLSIEYIYSFEEKFLNDSVQSCEKKKDPLIELVGQVAAISC